MWTPSSWQELPAKACSVEHFRTFDVSCFLRAFSHRIAWKYATVLMHRSHGLNADVSSRIPHMFLLPACRRRMMPKLRHSRDLGFTQFFQENLGNGSVQLQAVWLTWHCAGLLLLALLYQWRMVQESSAAFQLLQTNSTRKKGFTSQTIRNCHLAILLHTQPWEISLRCVSSLLATASAHRWS